MQTIEENIANTVTQEPEIFTINVDNPTFWHKIGLKRKKRTFKIYPINPGTRIRISKVANSMVQPSELTDVGDMITNALKDMETNMPRLIYIVALAITNRKSKPSKRLIEFLTWYGSDRLEALINMVILKMNVVPFTTTIISIKGMSRTPREIIAPDNKATGESLEDTLSTSDAPLNMHSGE
jgi:hypothetical protein